MGWRHGTLRRAAAGGMNGGGAGSKASFFGVATAMMKNEKEDKEKKEELNRAPPQEMKGGRACRGAEGDQEWSKWRARLDEEQLLSKMGQQLTGTWLTYGRRGGNSGGRARA